ncbi:MAG: IS1634 family transposase [Kiritimatiellae bacterium]|nr:IS1634 family transposase [Kiritimatiellia bacterium]
MYCYSTTSKELGASQTILKLAQDLGLDRLLYSRNETWVKLVMAMVVGRIIYQGNKLSLWNISEHTCLWELCGIDEKPDVEKHCYESLDRLLKRQKAIQKKLVAKHLQSGSLVLYDITNTYFEGEYSESDLIKFGYNRDERKGHKQVVTGLITNHQGCPVGCEVFEGNTKDATTVTDKIDQIRQAYGLEHFIFVGDRGMVTQGQFEKLEPSKIYVQSAR